MSTSATKSTDPLKRLPYEAWFQCIYTALSSIEGPLPYLAVSAGWCRAIVDEPDLWTSIYVGGEDEAARICTFLHLSQGHLLDITFLRLTNIEETFQVLMPHRQRIES